MDNGSDWGPLRGRLDLFALVLFTNPLERVSCGVAVVEQIIACDSSRAVNHSCAISLVGMPEGDGDRKYS